MKLTEAERVIIDGLAGGYNLFCELKELHPTDKKDFEYHIHALQRIILARPGLRVLGD